MVDYRKLLDEEKARRDSALANVEAQKKREVELVAFFRSVEIALGQEMAKANQELKRRGAPIIEGPFRPNITMEQIELTYGTLRPACRLTLESIAALMGLSRMKVELLDEAHQVAGSMLYVLEGESASVKLTSRWWRDFRIVGRFVQRMRLRRKLFRGSYGDGSHRRMGLGI